MQCIFYLCPREKGWKRGKKSFFFFLLIRSIFFRRSFKTARFTRHRIYVSYFFFFFFFLSFIDVRLNREREQKVIHWGRISEKKREQVDKWKKSILFSGNKIIFFFMIYMKRARIKRENINLYKSWCTIIFV